MKILTLEQALNEGKRKAFPTEEYAYSEDILRDKVRYQQIIRQMYEKGMVVGIK